MRVLSSVSLSWSLNGGVATCVVRAYTDTPETAIKPFPQSVNTDLMRPLPHLTPTPPHSKPPFASLKHSPAAHRDLVYTVHLLCSHPLALPLSTYACGHPDGADAHLVPSVSVYCCRRISGVSFWSRVCRVAAGVIAQKQCVDRRIYSITITPPPSTMPALACEQSTRKRTNANTWCVTLCGMHARIRCGYIGLCVDRDFDRHL